MVRIGDAEHEIQIEADHWLRVCVDALSADHTEANTVLAQEREETIQEIRSIQGDSPPERAAMHAWRLLNHI